MSLRLPTRRIATSAASLTNSHTPLSFLIIPRINRQTANLWNSAKPSADPTSAKGQQNPLTEEFLKRKAETRANLVRGSLSSSSIFEDEELAGPKPKHVPQAAGGQGNALRNPETMAAALDPDPRGRKLWERKMVIRAIKKRGRLSRTQLIKRQERELLSRSQNIKTSVKKLVPLAKQIAGKTVDDAIIQMRFSKKKAAKYVKEHLEHAKNEAIVRRGMGLGPVSGEKFNPIRIQTKDGKRIKVSDPTTLYVDQAWSGKGFHTKSLEYRARGQTNILLHRTTSLSVILKEEKTRIRLHNEREEKIKNRKVWVQLPNRPITTQRQYYSW